MSANALLRSQGRKLEVYCHCTPEEAARRFQRTRDKGGASPGA